MKLAAITRKKHHKLKFEFKKKKMLYIIYDLTNFSNQTNTVEKEERSERNLISYSLNYD
jgi:hypothetical protein